MGFYPNELVEKIRLQRKAGASIGQLEQEFGVSDSTISRWVRDIATPNKAFNSARLKEQALRSEHKGIAGSLKATKQNAKIFASLLYWCEGSKHPSVNFLAFTNSDSALQRTFISLLRTGFDLDEKKFRVHLQIHTVQDFDNAAQYWSELLKIPKTQFYKPTVTVARNNRKRRGYMGTCTLKYFDVKLLLRITGIYSEFAENFGEVA